MSKHTRMRNYRKMKSVSEKEQSWRPKDTRLRTCRIIRSYLGQIAIFIFFRANSGMAASMRRKKWHRKNPA